MRHLAQDLTLWHPKTGESRTLKAGTPVEVKTRRRGLRTGEGFAPFCRTTYILFVGGLATEMGEDEFKRYVA